MFGRHPAPRRKQPERRNRADDQPVAEPIERRHAAGHRPPRGQIDLVQELLRISPWYV